MDRIEIEIPKANTVLGRRHAAETARVAPLMQVKAEISWVTRTKARRFRESGGPPQDEPEPIAASRDGWRDGRLQDWFRPWRLNGG
jgi:hypothetical protein